MRTTDSQQMHEQETDALNQTEQTVNSDLYLKRETASYLLYYITIFLLQSVCLYLSEMIEIT